MTVQQQLPRGEVVLAAGLLVFGLAASLQVFLFRAVLPFMAQDLSPTDDYGVVSAVSWISVFVALPLGGGLSRRFGIGRVFVTCALLLAAGSLLAAVSPTFWAYLVGTIVLGVASGCLASVWLSALVRGLRARIRQVVLAGMAAIWVVAALAAPTYSASVLAAVGWRWAVVLYLPMILAAALIVASRLPADPTTLDGPRGYSQAFSLGAALALLVVPDLNGPVQIVALIAAGLLMLWSVRTILPVGRFGIRSLRRSAFAFFMVLCAVYFGAGTVLIPIAREVYSIPTGQLSLIVTVGGLSWALTSLACGARPVGSAGEYVTRAYAGNLLLISGLGWLALLEGGRTVTPWLTLAAWSVASAGMGLAFVDTLNILFTAPNRPDGLDQISVASGAVISGGLASAFGGLASGAYFKQGFGVILSADVRAHTLLLALAVIALAMSPPLIAVRRQWLVEGRPAMPTQQALIG